MKTDKILKIELTQLQAEKVIEAVKTMFLAAQKTGKTGLWLGLLHNLESQVYWKEQKKPYVLAWMQNEFKPFDSIDPFDRVYTAKPMFMEVENLKKSIHTTEHNIGGIPIRLQQSSPMHQTKSYGVLYQILKPTN